MYIGEQLINPTDDRLRLSAQLGCKGIIIDSRPNRDVADADGAWSATKSRSSGGASKVSACGSTGWRSMSARILLDSLRQPERAARAAERLRQNIRAAGEGGVPMLKYTVAMVGITRTGVTEGRGGMRCSVFRAADYRARERRALLLLGRRAARARRRAFARRGARHGGGAAAR